MVLYIGDRKIVTWQSDGVTNDQYAFIPPPGGKEWVIMAGKLQLIQDPAATLNFALVDRDLDADLSVDTTLNLINLVPTGYSMAGHEILPFGFFGITAVAPMIGLPYVINSKVHLQVEINGGAGPANLLIELDCLERTENFELWWYEQVAARMSPAVQIPIKSRL